MNDKVFNIGDGVCLNFEEALIYSILSIQKELKEIRKELHSIRSSMNLHWNILDD